MIGLLFRSAFAAPCAILGVVAAVAGICGCMRCARCRLRDCWCCKKLLRFLGIDTFDDFEMMVLVHEVSCERKEAKSATSVRLTAGAHTVKTDPNSNGIFQQPLHLTVEQGTGAIVVDLLDQSSRVLADLRLDITEHVLGPKAHKPEEVHAMRVKSSKNLRNPKVKLTMVVDADSDAERGLLAKSHATSDVDILVRQQLRKAKEEHKEDLANETGEVAKSEMEVLRHACSGPLELFEGLGKTANVYVAALGPPKTRRYVLGIWQSKRDFDGRRPTVLEVDFVKVESVRADPSRHHVFVMIYYDESRVRHTLTFRRIDRARDVWVEILLLMVQKAHEHHQERKREKASFHKTGSMMSTCKTGSMKI